MKREIKFRAWDNDAEVMLYSDKKEYDDYWWEFNPIKVGCITGESGGNQFEPPEPIVTYYEDVMQFTGLHDRNRKEIYEGDIVKGGNLSIAPVQFINGAFVWIYDHRPLGSFGEDSDTDIWAEVIGNIYENPELL